MKPIRYEDEAEEELIAAIHWYEDREEGLGYRFFARIMEAETSIQQAPEAWQAVPGVRPRQPPLRRTVVNGFPYIVVYLALETEIRVIAIAHTKRRPDHWRRRFRG